MDANINPLASSKSSASSDDLGVEAWLKGLGVEKKNTYCLLSNQSGEIGHVLAALSFTDDPAALVIVVRKDDAHGTASMERDFSACRFAHNVHLRKTSALPKDEAIQLYSKFTHRDSGIARPPTGATKEAQQKVKNLRVLGLIRPDWIKLLCADDGTQTLLARNIKEYCQEMKIVRDRPTVCLWTRHSGLQGANPQFDSSNHGMAAILTQMPGEFQLLLVGSQCSQVLPHLKQTDAIVLGEYWKQSPFKDLSRIEQNVLFYVLLSDWQCPLVHIGMKSGQMDMLALWGLPTLVIEDAASPTKSRTEYWTGEGGEQKGGKQKGGKQGVQTAVFVTKLPTTKGQAIRALDTNMQKASLSDQAREQVKNRKVGKEEKKDGLVPGFDEKDVRLIVERAQSQINAAKAALSLKATADRLRTLKEELPGFRFEDEDFA